MKYLYFVIICFSFCMNSVDSFSQITRGTQPGEIYLLTDWYWDGSLMHRTIIRSIDNGEHVEKQYTSTNPPSGADMNIGDVVGDATPGAVCNYGDNELWVSFDYGENWELVDDFGSTPSYTSGSIEGEIYKCCANLEGTVWHSMDLGMNLVKLEMI